MSEFEPSDWWWIDLAKESVYSSALQQVMPLKDALELESFQKWRAKGRVPTPWPVDENNVVTNEALEATLKLYGQRMFPETLEEKRDAKMDEIQDAIAKAILSGFHYSIDGVSYKFSYDMEDQTNFSDANSEAILYISGGENTVALLGPYGRSWRGWLDENTPHVFAFTSPWDFLKLSAAAANHKTITLKHGWDLQQSILNAKTQEELDAVVWTPVD